MKAKYLKEMLKTIKDDVEITLVTFDYETGDNEFYLNFSCTQNDKTKLRLTKGLSLKMLREVL